MSAMRMAEDDRFNVIEYFRSKSVAFAWRDITGRYQSRVRRSCRKDEGASQSAPPDAVRVALCG